MNPQGPSYAQLRKDYADEIEWNRIAEIERQQAEYDERERNYWLDFQQAVADGAADTAVDLALEMDEEYQDGRQTCPVFRAVKWLKDEGLFKAKMAIEWIIFDGGFMGQANDLISFGMRTKHSLIDGHPLPPRMILQIDGLKMAFEADGNFTETLKSIVTAQKRYKEEFE